MSYDTEWSHTPKIGDWIIPIEPTIKGINYGYNKRLIIEVSDDKYSFTTTCEAFGIEKNLWDVWNTNFVARLTLE